MDSDDAPYMQVDFKKETVVTALASQGLNFPLGNWVKKYSLNYSCDGLNWQTYKSLDKNAVLNGNIDGDSVVTNKLDEPIIARVIRINPLEWNPYGMVCMRLEMYGCDTKEDGSYNDCAAAAGMENRQIADGQVTASSYNSGHKPSQGRLNNLFKQVNGSTFWDSWCASSEDTSQYLQVDLENVRDISGIATQGSVMGTWVTEYMLNYSVDGSQWKTYSKSNSSEAQILRGNKDGFTVNKIMFEGHIKARYVRFNPRTWTPLGQICMRVEIYLCRTYQGCPRPDRIPSTATAISAHQGVSPSSAVTAATKIKALTRGESELHTDSVWQLYSAALRDAAVLVVPISILTIGWLLQ